uniref:CSON004730 protein n=1 Tax=Culicoides sonorensis TaxID=179676 RepID=A0A336LUB5_CULSO
MTKFFILIILLNITHFRRISAHNLTQCSLSDTQNITSGQFDSGNYHHDRILYPHGYFGLVKSYINENGSEITSESHIRGCSCMNSTLKCIRRCCLDESLIDSENCVDRFDKPTFHGITKNEIRIQGNYKLIDHEFTCAGKEKFYIVSNEFVKIGEDQTIYINNKGSVVEINYAHYCIDVNETERTLLVGVCHKSYDFIYNKFLRFRFLGIEMLVSVPFFLVTMIVHAVIPELRNVHGMSLMSYVGGLTVAYLFMGTNKILGTRNACLTGAEPCYNLNFCTVSGYIIYFSIMLSFFWLNAMCFDIFSTFRHIRISKAPKKKFLYYCIYAWGMASLLTIITISIDASNSISDDYKPGMYYTGNCFLSAKKIVQFIYLHMILLVLISLNTTFFVITAIKINRVRSETDKSFAKNNNSSHSNPNHNKDRFILYLLNWSMELISWMIDGDSAWFYVTDSINMLQGPLIFIFVLCTKHSRSLIIKRFKTV